MTYEIDAVYSKGTFVPTAPLALPEGAHVHLQVSEGASQSATKMMTAEEKHEFIRMIAELPIQGPDEGFSGADHDKLLYGTP
jgi:predicted DNA-binding antitoxin AbrB/MazE fold protein